MRGACFVTNAVLAAVLACECSVNLTGQQLPSSNSSESSAIFRSSVNRVILDVVVTDNQGKPVSGLTQKDFSIAEDGAPQRVLSFDMHDLDNNTPLVSKLPPLPANTFVNIATAPERGPLYVLLLDLVNTERDHQPYGRAQLLKFVSSKPEGTRFAIFCLSDGLHLVQGFTSDRDKIYAALDPSSPRSHVPRIFLFGPNYGQGDPILLTSVFADIGRYLDGLPGRKNLIWVSGTFPVELFPGDDIANQLPDIRNREIQAIDALTRSETAIYPINVRGPVTNPEGALTGGMPNGGAGGYGSGTPMSNDGAAPSSTGGPVATAMKVAGHGSSLTYDYAVEDEVATLTGGRAFYGTNDLAEALDQATDMGAHYYTLTYSPSNTNYNGNLRAIRVTLDKKGYRLAYRHAYYGNAPQSPLIPVASASGAPARPIGDSLSANMQPGAPVARDIFFRAHVQALGSPALGTPEQMANLADQPAYFKKRKKDRPAKPLAPVELQTYLIDYTVVGRQPNLEVAAAVYDSDSVMLNGDVEEATAAATPGGAGADSYFRIQQRIDVPTTAKTMRLAVRDTNTDRIGALEISLPLQPESTQASLPAGSTPPSKTN